MIFRLCDAPTTFMRLMNDIYVNFYKFIFYYLFQRLTSIHCDIGGEPITFHARDRDFKEALNVGASKYDFSQ